MKKKRFKKLAFGGDPGDVDTSGLDPITAGGQQAIAHGTQQIQDKLAALQQLGSAALAPRSRALPPDSPEQFMNSGAGNDSKQSALANSSQYDQQMIQKLKANAAAQALQQQKENALDEPIDESGYQTYARGGEVASDGYVTPPSADSSGEDSEEGDAISKPSRFAKLRGSMTATAEQDASKDPMEFMKKNKNMSIRGKKGVAF